MNTSQNENIKTESSKQKTKKLQKQELKNEREELKKQFEELKKLPARDTEKIKKLKDLKDKRNVLVQKSKKLSGTKVKEPNLYLKFVQEFRKKNPDLSHIQAMSKAKPEYEKFKQSSGKSK